MAKSVSPQEYRDPSARSALLAGFMLALLLVASASPGSSSTTSWSGRPRRFPAPKPGGPESSRPSTDLKGVNWNYVGGFALIFLGLALMAHPSTPLGRGRGVVVGMLGCFLIGLVWICTTTSSATTPPRSR